MSTVQNFLLEVRGISDPKDRLARLECAEWRDLPEVAAARAWWHARYYFTNRKKTQTCDRYIWFLLNLRGWEKGGTSAAKKAIEKTYREAFLSSEAQAAMELEDRAEAEILDACTLYIETIDPGQRIFGFSFGPPPSKEEVIKRIAGIVSGILLPALYTLCALQPRSDVIARCLCKGAGQVYGGALPVIEANVRGYADGQMRDFVLSALAGQDTAST